jgi:hypothetical protein
VRERGVEGRGYASCRRSMRVTDVRNKIHQRGVAGLQRSRPGSRRAMTGGGEGTSARLGDLHPNGRGWMKGALAGKRAIRLAWTVGRGQPAPCCSCRTAGDRMAPAGCFMAVGWRLDGEGAADASRGEDGGRPCKASKSRNGRADPMPRDA